MVLLLLSLIEINHRLRKERQGWMEKTWVQAGFGLYYGWVTVATVLNVTSWLVRIRWNALGIAPYLWAMAVLVLCALLALAVLYRYRNVWYGAAVIWGIIGIIVQRIKEYQAQSGWVIAAGAAALLILLWPMYRAAKQPVLE